MSSSLHSAALLASLLFAAAVLYLPPGEFALGGWDAGVYFNTAVALASHGGFTVPDPLLSAAGSAAQNALIAEGYLQPGFYWDAERGGTVTQFPFLLAVWMGVAVLVGGPEAAFYVPVVVALLATAAFYLMARHLVGPVAALVAAALLAFNGLQLWHARISLAEEMVQLFLFGGLWAGLVWRERGDRTAAVVAGITLGLLPLVKTEGALLGVLGCLVVGARSRWFWAPYLGACLLAVAHYAAFARPAAYAQLAAAWPFIIVAAVVALGAAALMWSRRPRLLLGPGAVASVAAVTAFAPPDLGFLQALWTGLYLTPLDGMFVAVGIAAFPRTRLPVMAAVLAASVFYLLLFRHYYGARDEIPLFMWAARRLVPVVLPVVMLAEAAGLVWAVSRWVAPRWQAAAMGTAVAALIGLRVPDLAALTEAREYHGALNAVAAIAARLEPDAVVLLDDDHIGIRFAAPLTWVAKRPSYLLRDGAPAEGVKDFLRTDRPVYYLTAKGSRELMEHGPSCPCTQAGAPVLQAFALHPRGGWRFQLPELERTSERRPAQWHPFTADLHLFRVVGTH